MHIPFILGGKYTIKVKNERMKSEKKYDTPFLGFFYKIRHKKSLAASLINPINPIN